MRYIFLNFIKFRNSYFQGTPFSGCFHRLEIIVAYSIQEKRNYGVLGI